MYLTANVSKRLEKRQKEEKRKKENNLHWTAFLCLFHTARSGTFQQVQVNHTPSAFVH